MKDFKLTISSLGYFTAQLTKLVTASPNKSFRVSVKVWRESRSLSQNSLYWKWLGEIAKQWEVSNDPEILHEIFKILSRKKHFPLLIAREPHFRNH